MRRAGDLWPLVRSFGALADAARRAGRGKRRVHAVAAFLDALEPRCLAIQRALDDGTWRPGPTSSFEIHDPKARTITVTPFEDRVVHHALIAPLEPVFERRMIADSFACRRGKGLHRALDRAQELARRYRYSLKLDVHRCFASIGHGVVMTTLARCVKDPRVLTLAETILRGPSDATRVGLPIGCLTSQWFANLTLDRVDHFAKETLRVPGYVRYMDDMVLFAPDKERLHGAREAVEGFLAVELGLRLKARATRLAPTACGVPFLGVQVYPCMRRLRPDNRRRARWRLRHRRWQLARGLLTEAEYLACVQSTLSHLEHAGARPLRRRWFAGHSLDL